ncbi:hypothetical protein [Mycobacteroides abscessus]
MRAIRFGRRTRSLVVAAALATALSGCTVYQTLTKPTEIPQTTTAPTVSDQEQIRQVTAQMGKALGSLDLDAGNALTCPRYQVSSRTADEKLVPSINSGRAPSRRSCTAIPPPWPVLSHNSSPAPAAASARAW